MAAEFFVQDDKVAEIDADLKKKIQQLRDQAEEKKTAAQIEARAVVQRMINTGESKKSVADRLGLSAAELKRYVAATPPVTDSENETSTAKINDDPSSSE